MCIELKIKSKHLALEPQIIKHEERKLKHQMKHHRSDDNVSSIELERKLHSLTNHRKCNVRFEARATYLARAYLEGKDYKTVEHKRDDEGTFQFYIVPRIVSMVTKYGKGEQRKITKDTIIEWSKL